MSDWVVHHGDCMDVLKTLDAGSVDAVVTDIPYNEVNRETGGLRFIDKGSADSALVEPSRLAMEFARISSGSVYVWCGTEQVSVLRAAFVEQGMTTRLCIWEKTDPSPMNGERFWLSSVECCVFARHPMAWFGRHCESPVWRGPRERHVLHPTPKPEWLMRIAVDASVPSDGTVFDPFCGSGTTGVACMQTGRNFIGVEIDAGYVDIARRRISEAANHLFREVSP